jgi:tRNA 5-methylaminomethyl-2-thiouridine biosynthesis bifunctional protein
MPRLPPEAKTHIDEAGLIFGDDFNDSYFSRDNGLEESRAVFLKGCGLPHAWSDKSGFVIGELGFGTGLNVLAVWDAWRKSHPKDAILHIVTIEGFLLAAELAKAAHTAWPELQDLSDKLIANWPVHAYGAQRIWFHEEAICITFLIGPCAEMLKNMAFQADCWFLDGFSPARNPDMWSEAVFAQIARLSAPRARLATYSVAGRVKTGLTTVGFDISREPGFGTKRQRLEARLNRPPSPEVRRPTTAMIIGGGIAGCSLASALMKRGLKVDLFDSDPCAATKASGNPIALVKPRLDRADTAEGRFFRAAFLFARRIYGSLGAAFEETGVLEIGTDPLSKERLVNLGDDPPLPADYLLQGENDSLIHKKSGLAYPHAVLASLKQGAICRPVPVARIAHENGQWRAFDEGGVCVASADICVLANGPGIAQFTDMGPYLRGRAGQLSWASFAGDAPFMPVTGGAYAAPFHDQLVFGATFDPCDLRDAPPPVSVASHLENCDKLAGLAPDLARQIDVQAASGRTSIRVTTPDHLPIVGAVPQADPGLYVLTGLGSRGFTTAFLCAEIIASQACSEPSPVETAIAKTLAPDRFARRAAKRTKSSPPIS